MTEVKAGTKLGTSDWIEITQPDIDTFGAVTQDPDPYHVDPEFARENSELGTTIAFGFQTIAMLTRLLYSAMERSGHIPPEELSGQPYNYGFNRLRLLSPVPVGARIRGHFEVLDVENRPSGTLMTYDCKVEIEGQDKPAMVAHWLALTPA